MDGGSDCRAGNWQTRIFLLSLSFFFHSINSLANGKLMLVGLGNLVQSISPLLAQCFFRSWSLFVWTLRHAPSPCAGWASELCVFVLEQDEKKWWEVGDFRNGPGTFCVIFPLAEFTFPNSWLGGGMYGGVWMGHVHSSCWPSGSSYLMFLPFLVLIIFTRTVLQLLLFSNKPNIFKGVCSCINNSSGRLSLLFKPWRCIYQ